MNKWILFTKHAKTNNSIPKDVKSRAKLYKDYKESCQCDDAPTMCKVIKTSRKCQDKKAPKKTYSPSKDPLMLQAKLQAYEQIVADKDAEIAGLVAHIDELELRLKKRIFMRNDSAHL